MSELTQAIIVFLLIVVGLAMSYNDQRNAPRWANPIGGFLLGAGLSALILRAFEVSL